MRARICGGAAAAVEEVPSSGGTSEPSTGVDSDADPQVAGEAAPAEAGSLRGWLTGQSSPGSRIWIQFRSISLREIHDG